MSTLSHSSKLDAYESEQIQSFKRLGYTVLCLTAYEETLLIAIKGDQLLHFKVEFVFDSNKNKMNVRLNGPTTYKVFGKPVTEMHAVPEFNILLAIYDNMLHIHDLDSYSFLKSLPNTKGVTEIALYIKNEEDSNGIYGTNLRVCVAMGKKLMILEWTGEGFTEIFTDLVLDKPVKTIMWCEKVLCIGYKDEYILLKPATGDYKEIYSFGNVLKEPVMTKISDKHVMLGYDNTSVLVDANGKPVKSECITWTGIPQRIVYSAPYLLAVLPRYMEVRTLDPSVSIQQLDIRHVEDICQSRDVIFVKCKQGIYILSKRPINDRIKGLLKHKQFQLAIQIQLQQTDISPEEKIAEINKIQARFAVHLFCTNNFTEAMELFAKLDIDPSHVIGMLPDLLPSKLANSLEYPEKIPTIHGKDLHKAMVELVNYLQKKREEIVKEIDLKPFVPIMKHKRNDTLKNKDQALTVIDTTLLKCYVEINEAVIARLLRMPGNRVHFEEAESVLRATSNYSELIILYEQHQMHAAALAVMKAKSSKSSSPLRGLSPTIHKLQELGIANLGLIFEYAKWVMEEDPHEGLKIFTEDVPTVRELPRGHVSSFIQKNAPEVIIDYLEHIIYVWNDTTEELHFNLAEHLRQKVVEELKIFSFFHVQFDLKPSKAGAEDGALGLYRKKLIKFLKTSTVYRPDEIWGRLPFDSLFEERALLLGRMDKHEEALGIYVYILDDLKCAEEYCAEFYRKGRSEVYLVLLKVFLYPPAPLALGKKEFTIPPKPRTGEALGLLETHCTEIDMLKAIDILPEDLNLKKSRCVFETAIDTYVTRKYLCQVLRRIQFQRYLQVCDNNIKQCCKQYFRVDERTNCSICKLKIGCKSVFVHCTDGSLAHFGCYNREAFS